MNPIRLNPLQQFVDLDNLMPLSTGWQWQGSMSSYPSYNFMRNQPTSGVFNMMVKTPNSFVHFSTLGYTNLKVKSEIVYQQYYQDWLNVESPYYPVSNYTNLNNGTWKDFVLYIVPNLTIPLGNHLATVKFKIEGTRDNVVETLSTYDFPVNLFVFAEGYFHSPSQFTFHKNENLPISQSLRVGGNDWVLNIPRGLKITSLIDNIATLANGGYQSAGTGLTNFELILDDDIESVMGDNREIILPVTLVYNTNNFTIPVTVIQTGDVFPMNLNFVIASGIIDSDFRNININKLGDYQLECSPWLVLNPLELNTGRLINVSLADSSSFGQGSFEGFVNLIFEDETITVPVQVRVTSDIDLELEVNEIVFTKTMSDFVFTSSNTNNFIELSLTVPNETNQIYVYKTPFIQGKVNQNLGKVLDREINHGSEELYSNYPLNYFSINVKEKVNGNTVLEFNRNGIPVVKGAKPVVINNNAILQHNNVSRFTIDGFALVSILSSSGMYSYKLYKNSEEIYYSNLLFGSIVTLPIKFRDYNLNEGDTLDFVLLTNGEEIKKSFYMFPRNSKSKVVVYEDSFGLKSAIEFTGDFDDIDLEIENKYEKFDKKIYHHTRKFKVSEEIPVVINTGFILKKQIKELRELLNSSKVWLYREGFDTIEMVVKSEKLSLHKSENFINSYDVEFLINEKQYAQDYNF